MKKIEQIRNRYDIITEKQDADIRKLDALARSGLFESKKLPVLKRALEKEPEKMTIAERKVVVELLDSLISETVHNQTLNEARREPNTSGQYLTKYDPRFDNSAAVSERDLPTIIILKRKGIRVFGSNQKIGLYYSQYLDRYISIPFGTGVPSINEAVDYQKAYQDYVKDYGDGEDDKKKMPKSPEDLKKFVLQKAGEGKIRAKHYSVFSKNDGAERKELKKASNQYLKDKFFSGQITALDALSAKAGIALGAAVRRGVTEPLRDKIRQIRGKTKTAEPTVPEPQAAPKAVSAPKTLTKKQQDVKADVSVRMASAKKSAQKAKDTSVPEKTRKMAANRARKVATYAQIDKRKAGLMEKIAEVKARNQQLNELAPLAIAAAPAVIAGARVAGPMLAKVLARAPKKAPPAKPVEVPPVKTPPAKPVETPPAKPVETPPAKPVETPPSPPAKPVETPPAKPVETPAAPAKPAEAPSVTNRPAEVPAPKTNTPKPSEKAPAPKGGAPAAPKKPGRLGGLGRRLGLGLGAAILGGGSDDKSDKSDPAKYLDPAKFGLKITTSKPEAQVTTGVDKRQANLYRKALETPVSEEKEEAKARLKPAAFSMKVTTSAPKSKVRTGVEARMQKYERDYYNQQNESILKSMKNMISENITEMQLNIGESPVTINNTIAQKIVSVHESLSKENKRQMEKMLGESVESFKKIVNFAVRQ
jgi:hypothetical protein